MGCWHCAAADHPRQKCQKFLDILAKNDNKLPRDYEGKYEKWLKNQQARSVQAVVQAGDAESPGDASDTEPDDDSTSSGLSRISNVLRRVPTKPNTYKKINAVTTAPPTKRTTAHKNNFTPLTTTDDDDGASEIIEACMKFAHTISNIKAEKKSDTIQKDYNPHQRRQRHGEAR